MTYRPAPEVAWVLDIETPVEGPDPGSPTVVVARLPDGDPFALAGSAAAIWLAALDASDEETVVVRVSEDQDVPVGRSGPDTRAFLAELVDRGLLVSE